MIDSSVTFQAVSGPIEQRATPLDLDVTRANVLPEDYETDLELDWSNPSKSFIRQTPSVKRSL